MIPDAHDMAVGMRLAQLRKAKRMGQTEFASALGISQPALINYERGRRALPSVALLRIYEKFGVDPLWVLTGPDSDPRPYAPDVDVGAIVTWGSKVDRALKRAGRDYPQELRDRLVAFCCAHQRKSLGASDAEVLQTALVMAA